MSNEKEKVNSEYFLNIFLSSFNKNETVYNIGLKK